MKTMGRECQNLRNHLVAYLYDEVPEPNASRLREHLALCPSCTEELDALYRTRESVEWYRLSTPVEPPSVEFADTVMERIRNDDAPRASNSSFRNTSWIVAAAASLIIGAIVAFTLPITNGTDSTMDASLGLGVGSVGSIGYRGAATSTVESKSFDENVESASPAVVEEYNGVVDKAAN